MVLTPLMQSIIIGRGYGLAASTLMSLSTYDSDGYQVGLNAAINSASYDLQNKRLGTRPQLLYVVACSFMEQQDKLQAAQQILIKDRLSQRQKDFRGELLGISLYLDLDRNLPIIETVKSQLKKAKAEEPDTAPSILGDLEKYLLGFADEAVEFQQLLA